MRQNLAIIVFLLLTSNALASMTSANLRPMATKKPWALKTYINTNDCAEPIRSTPYIMIAGSGGADMNLSCPPERPVMYSWKQQVGFVGFPSGPSGGGRSWITCCAVAHRWEKADVTKNG